MWKPQSGLYQGRGNILILYIYIYYTLRNLNIYEILKKRLWTFPCPTQPTAKETYNPSQDKTFCEWWENFFSISRTLIDYEKLRMDPWYCSPSFFFLILYAHNPWMILCAFFAIASDKTFLLLLTNHKIFWSWCVISWHRISQLLHLYKTNFQSIKPSVKQSCYV